MARDWRTITDKKEKYAAYLCSREWGVLREAVHARAMGKCERCVINDIDAVHHLTYKRQYKERLEDLQGLCERCHAFTHGRSNTDPLLDIYRPEIGINEAFPAFAILICPICKGRITTISKGRSEEAGGVDLYCLEVTCASIEGEEHRFDLVLLPVGRQTALTTKGFIRTKT